MIEKYEQRGKGRQQLIYRLHMGIRYCARNFFFTVIYFHKKKSYEGDINISILCLNKVNL